MYIKLSIRYPILICQKMTSFYFPLLPVCKSVYPLAPHSADANTATSSVIQVGNLGVTETCSYPWSLHHFGPKSCQFYLLDLYQPSPFLPFQAAMAQSSSSSPIWAPQWSPCIWVLPSPLLSKWRVIFTMNVHILQCHPSPNNPLTCRASMSSVGSSHGPGLCRCFALSP